MKLLIITVMVFMFTECKSPKLDNNPPFKIALATYNNWFGGQPGVSGTKLNVYLSEKSDINFDSIFFHNKKAKTEIGILDGKTVVVANFINPVDNKDFISNKKPLNNQENTFENNKNIPFKLKKNEAVLSYIIENQVKYFKIAPLQKLDSLQYPNTRK